jgi:hypothetical protein
MTNAELKPNAVLLGEHNYETALALVIAKAQKELLIFDQNLSHGDYASLQRFELIQQFLSTNVFSKLTMIVQNSEFFVNKCPKLFELLKLYGHKMTVFETNDSAKIAKDCFVIADKSHYVRRFHIDQARFKFAFDDENEAANLQMRFDALLEETSEAVSATKLGL